MKLSIRALTLAVVLGCASCAAAVEDSRPAPATGLALTAVITGLDRPVHLTAPTGDARLFVVEQTGKIRVFENGRLLAKAFLDLSGRISCCNERGLLSMAFHPRYASNGFFFVNYTDRNGDTRVERYHVSSDRNVADPSSVRLLLHIDQPYVNHNGGHIVFGPDGMLWIPMGDGGSGGDPRGNAQNPATLLGKLLRIDVDHGVPYSIPASNPFRGRRGTRPEIWATGLRNPWRIAFDPPEGLLYIADVGQNLWEEIDVVPYARGGYDFGWNRREGLEEYRKAPIKPGTIDPVVVYGHQDGCSVTGGLVYRGRRMPDLVGHYFYGEYCSGWIRSFRYAGGKVTQHREWKGARTPDITSFGQDSAGELYVLSGGGTVYRMERRP